MSTPDHAPLTPLSFQVLVALAAGPSHGYGVIKEIEAAQGEPMHSSTGTLYLAIERLQEQGLIAEQAGNHPRRRNYALTARGRSVARAEAKRLATLLGAVAERKLVGREGLLRLLEPRSSR